MNADDIFLEARELDPGGRWEFLNRACAGDPDLRTEVDRLLADAERADAFFAGTLGECPAPAVCRGFSAEKAGDHVGPYRLIEKLGEGGGGVVWMAEQEKPISRRVAVKVIKAGMDTEAVLARFESERQALARMDHPNIARVLDVGATETGRPYFAMELVNGVPITRFCDEVQLDTKARLALFSDVCAAVNHAHQKGVIHRDIKPSNVLVALGGAKPLVKVIDFGIAKAVEGKLTDHTLHTIVGHQLGTPAYMSPEQAGLGGQDIDTRSDIYALGVLLYELLAGVPPFDPKTLLDAGYDEMRRIIREVEPARPSARITTLSAEQLGPIAEARRVSGDRLPKLIASDLDWIVMKAIEKSRDRRYESADSLAQDISRFVADKPVEAKPPTTLYLLRKFVRRNRTALRVAAGFLLLLLAATGVSTWQAARATKAEALAVRRLTEITNERNAKDRALQDAEAVSKFLAEVFQRPDPEMDGRTVTVAQALDAATEKLNSTLASQPERLALLQETLARTYAGLGLYSKSLELQKKVLEGRRASLGVENPATLEAMHQVMLTLGQLGYYREARDLGEEEATVRRRVNGSDNLDTLSAMEALGEYYFVCGQHDQGIATLKEVADRLAATRGASDKDSIAAHGALANYLYRVGNKKAADEAAQLTTSSTPDSGEQPALTDSEHQKKVKERLDGMEAELVQIRQKSGLESKETLEFLQKLAGWYHGCEYRSEAVRIQEEVVALQRKKFGDEHLATIESEQELAYFLWRNHQWEPSRELLAKVIERQKKVFGPEHLGTLRSQSTLAQWLWQAHSIDPAMEILEETVPLLRKVEGSGGRSTLIAISNLARCYTATGRSREAIDLLTECAPQMRDDTFINFLLAQLQLWFGLNEEYNKTRNWMMDYAKENRARFRSRPDILERSVMICCLAPLENEKQGEELLATLARCKEIRAAGGGPQDWGPGPEWRSFVTGMAHFRVGDYQKAEEDLSEAARLLDGKDKWPLSRAQVSLYQAMKTMRQGNLEAARELYLDTAKTIKPPPSEENPLLNSPEKTSVEPLSVWLAQREMRGMLEPSGRNNPASP